MSVETITLPDDPKLAVEALKAASLDGPVLVFKRSPICPVSFAADAQYEAFLAAITGGIKLRVVVIDVIAERHLARGLVAELGVRHESPQALLFRGGELRWHDSHDRLTLEIFNEQVSS